MSEKKEKGSTLVCVRLPEKMVKQADKLRKTVSQRTAYGLDATRSDVLRVALNLGFDAIKKGG